MLSAATDPDAPRHRLLEGVLLRLARRPDANEFVLRGGLLMRHWFRPAPRAADDVDLVATFPFDVEVATRRFLPVFDEPVEDSVTFDPDRTRVTGIRLDTGTPGIRVFATGTANGIEIDFNVDVTFGPHPRPAPVLGELPTASGAIARLWMCRPESVAAQKIQALWHRGMLAWRPKDLNDLRQLLARVPMDVGDLRAAIGAYMQDIGDSIADARALFGPSAWWDMKMASARWTDFVRASRDSAPRDLAGVVAEVGGRLAAVLEDAS